MSAKARILLICDDRRGHANTVLDHIDAFRQRSRHQVRTFNPKAMSRSWALDLDEFDVVVIHYSMEPSDDGFVSAHFRDKLRRFRGLKIQFIQDDYRWVDRATAASRDVGIRVLFTVAPAQAAAQFYDERLPGVRRVHTLTGYVPDNLRNREPKPLDQRTIDVGYRARDLPFWLGRLSREKVWIGERFLEFAPPYGLRCDISWREPDRMYGSQWIDFVSSCRATLGTESGASIADFDGSVERDVRSYLRNHPGARYEEVHEAVLRPYEGNVIVNVVSPRVFEAAALGTAMVMFPGQYSGVVSPGEHYISLEKDFSNIKEVVERLRDDSLVAAMTARAHEDLIESGRWSYASFIAEFDRVVDEETGVMRGRAFAPKYRLAKAERAIRVPSVKVRLFRVGRSALGRVLRRDPSMSFAIDNESQIDKGLLALRLVLRDRDLRSLLWLGRRAGAPIDRLLREILELSLLRKAAEGGLVTGQSFTVLPEYEAARKALCFVSTPTGYSPTRMDFSAREMSKALHAGQLDLIEWDHRALGGRLRLSRPQMEVGIGTEGLESFGLLVAIGRRHPAELERALAPAICLAQRAPITLD